MVHCPVQSHLRAWLSHQPAVEVTISAEWLAIACWVIQLGKVMKVWNDDNMTANIGGESPRRISGRCELGTPAMSVWAETRNFRQKGRYSLDFGLRVMITLCQRYWPLLLVPRLTVVLWYLLLFIPVATFSLRRIFTKIIGWKTDISRQTPESLFITSMSMNTCIRRLLSFEPTFPAHSGVTLHVWSNGRSSSPSTEAVYADIKLLDPPKICITQLQTISVLGQGEFPWKT